MSRFATAAALVLLIAAPLRAQDKDADPRAVQPERPTVATHAHTVAPGYVEIETGVQGDHDGKGQRAWSVPTVTKIGLTSHMQLNLSTPAFASGAGQSSGIGDVSVGVKWRLLDEHAVLGDFALLPAIKFPTGSMTKGTGSGTVDVGVTAIASYDIRGVAMDLNAAYTRIGAEGSSAPSSAALWTASFGFPVSGRLSWVAELFGQPTIDGSGAPSTAAFLTGPTYLVSSAFNLDAGVIAPFHGDMPNAVYSGLVWNVGSIAQHQERAARSRAR
jgi:Putative MetA-pathway of phenol degradation